MFISRAVRFSTDRSPAQITATLALTQEPQQRGSGSSGGGSARNSHPAATTQRSAESRREVTETYYQYK
jgi:hypothetical protein